MPRTLYWFTLHGIMMTWNSQNVFNNGIWILRKVDSATGEPFEESGMSELINDEMIVTEHSVHRVN